MKSNPLPKLPARCPLCRHRVHMDLCICGSTLVLCDCEIVHRSRERTARKAWIARVAAKQKKARKA